MRESREECGISREGFEVSRYDYFLTEAGAEIAEIRKQQLPNGWAKIKAAADKIRASGDPDYVELSVAAKAYFLLGQVTQLTSLTDLVELADRFGWHINEEQVEKAWYFLEQLGCLETSAEVTSTLLH